MNLTDSKTWIGLQHSQFSSKWSNGDEVTFSALTGSCGPKPDCAAMKTDASWESLQCGTEKRNFMCYEQDQTDLTFSYHLITENKTWYEAQSYCRKIYTDLVSIRDQEQNEAVKIAGMKSSDSFWIGLLRDDWEWADGGRSAYRNWGDSQPRSSTLSNCTQLNVNGKWQNVPCNNTLFAALCYNAFLHVSEDRMNWENALYYCKKDNRAGLLHIHTESDHNEVKNELRRRGISGTLWVGLGQSQLFGFWFWSDGSDLSSWTNWVGGQVPQLPLSQHCGAIDTEQDFKWLDKNCRYAFRVLCSVK
ncbi:macrophage mannose receptor 1-like [Astyanax mexicanus]|uniref:Macrophage mannose receptor 1-like n=1 Tax=Astyanax mexicanus TaxID=7994 RepID=A0A8T2M5C9_ASTMX|nr:macrophage mannose receptor 1-like [Astyanax mexicanus]